MVQLRSMVGVVLAAAALVALSGCGSATPGGTGSLALSVKGLPSGVDGNVQVGFGAFTTTVTTSTTLAHLTPGTYTIDARAVTLRGNAFHGSATPSSVTVTAGGPATASVTYARPPSDLWVSEASSATSSEVAEYGGASLAATPSVGQTLTNVDGPGGAAFDAQGNLWIAASNASTVVEYLASSLATSPTVGSTITTAGSPLAVAFDAAGNLWVATRNGGGAVTAYAASSLAGTPSVTTSLTGLSYPPQRLAFDPPPYTLPLSH